MARFLLLLPLLFSLSSCEYKADLLPDYIVADYEIAFPIADTTFAISDFFQSSSIPSLQIEIPKGTMLGITIDYPFYLSDLSDKDYKIYWIEPKAIIGNQFPEIINVTLSCYISSLTQQRYTLADNQQLTTGENTLFTSKRIETSEFPIEQANKLYIIIQLTAKENSSIQELLESELKVNFGLKAALQINHTL